MFRSLLLVTIPFISIAAHAVTFDYRHETNDKAGNNHKDRLLMSHRFANGFWPVAGREMERFAG